MCKTCIAHLNTVNILQSQLDREKERADRLEKLLFAQTGILNDLPDADTVINIPVPGRMNWDEVRRKLEADDLKSLNAMKKAVEAI